MTQTKVALDRDAGHIVDFVSSGVSVMTPQPNNIPIWRLVELAANELTKEGRVPFSRKDLVASVQRSRPDCGPDSINPIVQGLTDNLRGGAPGAVGKDILHSVGRGQFVLARSPAASPTNVAKLRSSVAATSRCEAVEPANGTSPKLLVAQYEFRHICPIEPRRTADGRIEEFLPQSAYRNDRALPLNSYGLGPFCRFSIPRGIHAPGVYAITADYEVRYVGECTNLSQRYNNGYGRIAPRACYRNGQETNCRINTLLLTEAKAGAGLALWYLPTEHYKIIEWELINSLAPPWNLRGSKLLGVANEA